MRWRALFLTRHDVLHATPTDPSRPFASRRGAKLIDAASGAHLWADRFDEDVADIFKLQDEVVARLANSLGYELIKAEAKKSVPSKSRRS
jgi:hypothetical protein